MADDREHVAPAQPIPLPIEQMRELLTALRGMVAEAPRAHGLHWLLFQRCPTYPLMCQFTWQEAWMLHTQIALTGLLQQAVEQGNTAPELLHAIAAAIADLFESAHAADRTWEQFLQAVPAARHDPMFMAFSEMERMEGEKLQALRRPAEVVYTALMQELSLLPKR